MTTLMSGGCRLCLDSNGDKFTSIENPQLIKQMDRVFSFSVIPIDGVSKDVCQHCSYIITEFYQYSEQVRLNQEAFLRAPHHQTSLLDSEIVCEDIKVELHSDEEFTETSARRDCLFQDIKLEQNSDEALPDEQQQNHSNADNENSQAESLYSSKLPKRKTPKISPSLNEKLSGDDRFLKEHFSLSCELCGATSLTFAKLRSHFRLKHDINTAYVVCCDRKFIKRNDIVEHVKWHLDPNVFQCEYCQIRYKSGKSLYSHQQVKHMTHGHSESQSKSLPINDEKVETLRNGNKESTAEFTNEQLKFLQTKRQQEDQFLSDNFTFTCHLCNATKPTFSILRNHIRAVHKTYHIYVTCCNEKFRKRSDLISHIKGHTNVEQTERTNQEKQSETFECIDCRKVFSNRLTLKRHIVYVHASRYYCVHCNKQFSNKSNMQRHVNRTHKKFDMIAK